ncbi:MAG: serine hydrolase [Patescibacteria group bacterium]
MMEKIKQNMNPEQRAKYFFRALLVFSVLSVFIFIVLINSIEKEAEPIASTTNRGENERISIEAKSAFVWDILNQQELFSKNADLALPLASLTKVMTALTAKQILDDNDTIIIEEGDLSPEGDSDFKIGETWRAQDLIDFVLITSSNDGAHALAKTAMRKEGGEEDFIKKMNKTALDIGLENSRFWNEHGLDRRIDRGGAYGSARDMARLFEYSLKNSPNILEATRHDNLAIYSSATVYNAINTNVSVSAISGLLASKTGFTDLAGGNLTIIFDAGLQRPVVVAVLGSSEEGRFSDTLKLVEMAMKKIKN